MFKFYWREQYISELSNFSLYKQILITILNSVHLRDIVERRQILVKYGNRETHLHLIIQIRRLIC